MKKIFLTLTLIAAALCSLRAQIYAKLNGLYALVGAVNPAAEFVVSPRGAMQLEAVYSPWKSVNGHHMQFGILMGEYRRYFQSAGEGWYLGGNLGMMLFDVSKPEIRHGKLQFENRYSKGNGLMIGLCAGYERRFAERWLVDAYLGWAWMHSWYNGYSMDGQIDLYPHRPVQPRYPDPYNKSAEWYPNKIGVSIGYLIFNPAKNPRRH